MKINGKILLVALLAGMIAVSGCNKKTRKAEGKGMDQQDVSTMAAPIQYGPDGQPLGEWQGSVDNLSKTTIYFAYDSSDLDAESQAVAEAHASYLMNNAARVVLEGHADERGTREYNLALGERRAKAVASVFEALGVNMANIETVSYGEENPAVEGHDESAWHLNRRVEIRYE
jgi:peptidoglycan-associated lipoprotein